MDEAEKPEKSARLRFLLIGANVAAVLLFVGALVFLDDAPLTGCSSHGPPQDADQVLFIGNSHTYHNRLPRMVENLARSDKKGRDIVTTTIAEGGFRLSQHQDNDHLKEIFAVNKAQKFDVMVLQGGSSEPLEMPQHYIDTVEWYAYMGDRVGIETVLFEVWPWAPGHSYFGVLGFEGPDAATAQIQSVTGRAAVASGARAAPVARAFRFASQRAPHLLLYQEDGNHASIYGTYLASLVIYATLRQRPVAAGAWRPEDISAVDAAELIAIANAAIPR